MGFLIVLFVYFVCGYASVSYLRGDDGSDDFGRAIVYSVLFGWAAIPIALLLLIGKSLISFIAWLFHF